MLLKEAAIIIIQRERPCRPAQGHQFVGVLIPLRKLIDNVEELRRLGLRDGPFEVAEYDPVRLRVTNGRRE